MRAHPITRPHPSRRAYARLHWRHDLACALLRVRTSMRLSPDHDVKQPVFFVPAARFCARVLHLCFAHPNRGWAERRETFGCSGTRGACSHASKTRVNALMTRHARRLRGALRPMTRDARLSALHRGGFGLRGRASLTGICAGSVTANSSHPGRSAWRATSRASRGERLRAAAAGRHASLRIRDRL